MSEAHFGVRSWVVRFGSHVGGGFKPSRVCALGVPQGLPGAPFWGANFDLGLRWFVLCFSAFVFVKSALRGCTKKGH